MFEVLRQKLCSSCVQGGMLWLSELLEKWGKGGRVDWRMKGERDEEQNYSKSFFFCHLVTTSPPSHPTALKYHKLETKALQWMFAPSFSNRCCNPTSMRMPCIWSTSLYTWHAARHIYLCLTNARDKLKDNGTGTNHQREFITFCLFHLLKISLWMRSEYICLGCSIFITTSYP